MYKQQDYYADRRGLQFGYEFENEPLALSASYAHDPSYYPRGYRSAPYPRTTRSLTPQDSISDCNQIQRKRIAVACSRCRKRKIKCSGESMNGMGCTNCQNAGANNCNFVRVGATEIGEFNGHIYGANSLMSTGISLVSYTSPPKIHGLPVSNYQDQLEKDISPTVASSNEGECYYRQGAYGIASDARGSIAPSPSTTSQEFGHYAIPDRNRRQMIHIEHTSPSIQSLYTPADPNHSQFHPSDLSVHTMQRNNMLSTTSAPSMNVEDHYTATPQYLSERQLPPLPPRPTLHCGPNPYDITQRSSSFYFPGHTYWSTQSTPYSCIRTPVPHDIERNSVSSYRSGSFTDSNGYSIPNTSQSSLAADAEYGNEHRNGAITASIPYTTDSMTCSQPAPSYNIRKAGGEMEHGILVNTHNKPEVLLRESCVDVKEVPSYAWSPHLKRQAYVTNDGNNNHMDNENMQPLSDNAAAKTLSALRIGCDHHHHQPHSQNK